MRNPASLGQRAAPGLARVHALRLVPGRQLLHPCGYFVVQIAVEGDLGPAAALVQLARDAGIGVIEREGAGLIRLAATTLAQGGNRASSRTLWQQFERTAEDEWFRNEARRRLQQRSLCGGQRQVGMERPRGWG